MMRRAAALSLVPLVCACAQQQTQSAPLSAAAGEPTTPVLLRYLPPDEGGPSVFPQALVHGVLDLAGPCVRLRDPEGRMTIVVSSPGRSLGRDAAGLYVQTPNGRLRHGSPTTGGGGWFDNFPAGLGLLDRPIPQACRFGPFVVVTGMQPHDPADDPPLRSPPPPPVG
ncbi:MAG: hypothetical protein ACR2JJ_06815 [Sphingomicrobium sp.]